MATLMEVRDLLALSGRMDAKRISDQLAAPLPLINAMLGRLEAMGKAERQEEELSGCLSGSCRRCPEGKACRKEVWRLR
ncbi:[Fe-S]-dependent transcriptional repressor FeoC [Cronobacter dublinensis]|uniref:[Fe-S]-dependent transcriptional repressor FeoC n=1 Tax=Cronobacter dublinensis TaxID=413497 RepID=UPI00039CF662|nr:[Fe-S]-dependent transcriptional repressor FeoC [Cronobacter dublinensis]MDI6441714.1 [Fe-S]-dependent transcriptional repressor FeoC [Cronobacter dublinensis]NCH96079.1 [Fe-S]-dependent transcriptional repressor FeoC [Cronobacter dublinensis]